MDNRYYFTDLKNDIITFFDREANHISRVRRCNVGDKIVAFNGDGFDYSVEITEISKSQVKGKVIAISKNRALDEPKITVYLAMIKNEALTDTIDYLAELNVTEVKLFKADYSVANIDNQKLEKLNTISTQSSKQCERATIMKISLINKSSIKEDALEQKNVFFAYENADEKIRPFSGDFALIIGPEGGFSSDEVAYFSSFARTISLGKTILRAGVASVASVSMLKAVNNAC